MPLHMTKIAYGATCYADLEEWFDGPSPERRLRTRYLPTRHKDMTGGSLFWIYEHALVASPASTPAPNARIRAGVI
jgi:hypothetical protein